MQKKRKSVLVYFEMKYADGEVHTVYYSQVRRKTILSAFSFVCELLKGVELIYANILLLGDVLDEVKAKFLLLCLVES